MVYTCYEEMHKISVLFTFYHNYIASVYNTYVCVIVSTLMHAKFFFGDKWNIHRKFQNTSS